MPATTGSGPDVWVPIWELTKLLLALGVVVFLIWLSSRLIAARFGGGMRAKHLKVLEQVAVGRERHLMLVQVAGRVLLLGSTPDNISLLATLDDPALTQEVAATPTPSRTGLEPFGAILDRFLDKGAAAGEQPAGDQQPESAGGALAEQIRRLKEIAKR